MKIVYNAQQRGDSDRTEEHLRKAIKELGHELSDHGDGDIYLFHKDLNPPLKFTGKKVCWYFDKIWGQRVDWFNFIQPRADYIFMTDGTWAKDYPKVKILRQGIGEPVLGKFEERNVDVAFIGNPYRERRDWALKLKARYKAGFKIYQNQFNEDLSNLCASVPVIVAPLFPSDDNYWSNRVYLITGSGGFLIHPRLKGLEEEYGDVLVYYDNEEDMYEKIDYYLAHPEERKAKQKEMYEFTKKHFTYKKRLKVLLDTVCQELK